MRRHVLHIVDLASEVCVTCVQLDDFIGNENMKARYCGMRYFRLKLRSVEAHRCLYLRVSRRLLVAFSS